eukprot:761864-Hanusia_phi.AAC.2
MTLSASPASPPRASGSVGSVLMPGTTTQSRRAGPDLPAYLHVTLGAVLGLRELCSSCRRLDVGARQERAECLRASRQCC